ncbi:hypothetical protein [Kineococcus sp. SYSU DK002]|uniref:hypothetical protein n=1 Tax=Kineococcus sp. SYSU DK002 TaxID=3383123 RepID=UPI003D7E3E90
MTGELSLFGDDEPEGVEDLEAVVAPIAPWQEALLRKSLDGLGLVTMDERQRAIETAAGRPVESLRSLTHAEALSVAERLAAVTPKTASSTTSWDDREESTWIDRL